MPTYGTVLGADAYHADHGNEAWIGTESDKSIALVRASQYLDAFYVWKPSVQKEIDAENVPERIEDATYEVALRELTTPGSMTPDYVATAQVTSKTEQVGPLMEKTEYATSTGAASSRPRIALIDGMLRGLVVSGIGGMNFAVSRV